MRKTLIVLAATFSLLIFGVSPAFAQTECGDNDALPGGPDGIDDCVDNCSDVNNPDQDDTDGDGCGNLCDGDYTQTGQVNFGDFSVYAPAYEVAAPNVKMTEPNSGQVNFGDFSAFAASFLKPPGPSGTTNGTTACP